MKRWLPSLIFVLHALLYWGWIVDDAAITWAYSRNLSQGLGPVAQAGALPVEGYSNPLWVAFWIPFYWLGWMKAPWVPKAVCLLLGLLDLELLRRLVQKVCPQGKESLPWAVGCLTALNPAFVLWMSSGLENPLYVALTLGLILLIVKAFPAQESEELLAIQTSWFRLAGIVAGALALTRPDGIVLALIPLVWMYFEPGLSKRSEAFRSFLPPFLVLYCGHLFLRFCWFGEWVPNTYFAKVSGGFLGLLHTLTLSPKTLQKIHDLGTCLVGPEAAIFVMLALGIAGIWLLRAPSSSSAERLCVWMWSGSMAAYLLLPADWMGECRFATVAIPLSFLVGLTAFGNSRPIPQADDPYPLVPAGVQIVLATFGILLLAAPSLRWRALVSASGPPISLSYVDRVYGQGLKRWKKVLKPTPVSILLPDVGALLLHHPDVQVHDLAGLTDRTMADLLHGPRAKLREYVLGELKPTFIHVNPAWAPELNLPKDPRFAEDYSSFYLYPPLKDFEFKDAAPGYYVRNEALQNAPGGLAELRKEDLSWKALLPKPKATWGLIGLAILPLPARAGWLPLESKGNLSPGRRRRKGTGEITLSEE